MTLFVMKKLHCTKFWTGAVVRYYGNFKRCCSYIVCHKPIKFENLVGNKLYFTIIMTFIPIEGKSKSYKHSLIIYWTALLIMIPFINSFDLNIPVFRVSNCMMYIWQLRVTLDSCGSRDKCWYSVIMCHLNNVI